MSPQFLIFLTAISGWINRKQQEVIEYLLEENRILKDQFDRTGRKLSLNNQQRRSLAKRRKALGWKLLQEYATLVTPETIMAWHRKLIALKYTAKRKIFFGEESLRKAVKEYVQHYHHERNHQGLDNLIPFPKAAARAATQGLIVKSERLGGLLNYYHREPVDENGKEDRKAA